jgi:hypothetical protein
MLFIENIHVLAVIIIKITCQHFLLDNNPQIPLKLPLSLGVLLILRSNYSRFKLGSNKIYKRSATTGSLGH